MCTIFDSGIVIGCARPGLPGLYTNVAHFLPWMLDIIKKRN